MPVPSPTAPATISAEEAGALLDRVYPQLNAGARHFVVTAVTVEGCVVRLHAGPEHCRAGGTVSGPALFTLADVGGYVCALAHARPDPLCVTTHLSINFLRKAETGAIDARCRVLKLGRRLLVFEADIVSAETGKRIAHATGTYSIPSEKPSAAGRPASDVVK